MSSLLRWWILLFPLYSVSCSSGLIRQTDLSRADDLVIWAHSDIQPRTSEERKSYRTVIQDVAENIGKVNYVILAGDIIQTRDISRTESDYNWFLSLRSAIRAENWFEIAGNHDAVDLSLYRRFIGKPLHYAVTTGNLLMIFMSDENGRTSGTDIPDSVFNWWKDLVEKNQDRIIITVTHSNPKGAGFGYSVFDYRNLQNSQRFERVLERQKVDLWLFGHTHVPSSLGMKTNIPDKYGTAFINVSAVREDFFISHPESRFLYFRNGSDRLIVRTRYHDSHEFVESDDILVTLSKPYLSTGEPVRFIFFE